MHNMHKYIIHCKCFIYLTLLTLTSSSVLVISSNETFSSYEQVLLTVWTGSIVNWFSLFITLDAFVLCLSSSEFIILVLSTFSTSSASLASKPLLFFSFSSSSSPPNNRTPPIGLFLLGFSVVISVSLFFFVIISCCFPRLFMCNITFFCFYGFNHIL